MNQAIRKLSGLLVLPVLLAALLLLLPVRANAEAVPYECYVDLPISVDINGAYEEQFHITIDGDDSQPMPKEAAEGLWISGDADGTFHGFHFTEPGDYVYTVKQDSGNTAYMSYDATVYTVTIRVTNADNGGLKSEVWAVSNDEAQAKAASINFLNTYAPPTPTPAPTAAPTATPTAKPATPTLPQTSDALPLTALVVVLIVAAVAIVALVVLRRRKNNGSNDQQ